MKITKTEDQKFLIEFDDGDISFPETEELEKAIRNQIFRPKEKYLEMVIKFTKEKNPSFPEGSLTTKFKRDFLRKKLV